MISHLDHIVYPLPEGLFAEVIGQWERAGFIGHTRQVQHGDGRVSAFFRLSGGYLEFCSEGAVGAGEGQDLRPCSIWLCSTDLLADVEGLSPARRAALAVTEKTPLGEEAPAWLIASLPARSPGDVPVSVIQYLRGIGTDLTLLVAENGLFAISGVSLLCAQPEQDRRHCFEGLGDVTGSIGTEEGHLSIGHQWLAFLHRAAQRHSGPVDLARASCLVHLATVDLGRTTAMLEAADFALDHVPGLGLLAQSKVAPSICLVIDTGLSPAWHQAQLLARRR
ncbi:hypothetical protein [Pseudomonas chlororaphis]|uniref:hypothetical protein n=1 Tax=Pseudomonas chlororaphis TaxID=587753 RepID=UPI0015DF18F3|nr:hypothetical protein [Pseudomonas chlororaphis]QLL10771.1 hypothetical protein H0I86_17040 [Pseudomonas chlororaphis subsp. aurantiaca]